MKIAASFLAFALALSIHAQTNFPGYIDASFTARCISNANYNNTVKGVHYGISLQWGPNTLLYNTKKIKPAPKQLRSIYRFR